MIGHVKNTTRLDTEHARVRYQRARAIVSRFNRTIDGLSVTECPEAEIVSFVRAGRRKQVAGLSRQVVPSTW